MAVTFIKEKNKQKYMLIIFFIVLLITGIVIWYGFFREEKVPVLPPSISVRDIKIDFDFLENPDFKNLEPFEGILPYDKEFGRENPFISY
ncbi:MAG: hypothetical protein PHI53_02855 [Candidatus Pacebacteria bacterium]|nr:hypothetical protein [Candidatus Paceibacterota bacterium]